MKELIRKILKEETEEVLELPSIKYFLNDWKWVIKFVKSEGNPLFSIQESLILRHNSLKTLGRLYSVEGNLDLYGCKNLTSLGKLSHVGEWLDLRGTNITSLGNLTHVGGGLDLYECKSLTSLGRLQHVGGLLDLRDTPMANEYSEEEIRKMVNVEGNIYL